MTMLKLGQHVMTKSDF